LKPGKNEFIILNVATTVEIIKPVFKPKIQFEASALTDTEQFAIVHCTITHFTAIRIWSTTYLVQENGNRKKLLHAFNIPAYPDYKYLDAGHRFTLVFERLDKSSFVV
jgi:hypothetical protein